jgi:hypothetical protein
MLKEFQISYQNIRSMRRNTDKLHTYLECVNLKPLLFGLSETWIFDEEIEDYSLDDYNLFAKCNNDCKMR